MKMNLFINFWFYNKCWGSYNKTTSTFLLFFIKVMHLFKIPDKIRIDVQSNLPKSERKYFKHSRGLLLSRRCKIKETKYDELEFMLNNYSEDLCIAYREKEDILRYYPFN